MGWWLTRHRKDPASTTVLSPSTRRHRRHPRSIDPIRAAVRRISAAGAPPAAVLCCHHQLQAPLVQSRAATLRLARSGPPHPSRRCSISSLPASIPAPSGGEGGAAAPKYPERQGLFSPPLFLRSRRDSSCGAAHAPHLTDSLPLCQRRKRGSHKRKKKRGTVPIYCTISRPCRIPRRSAISCLPVRV